MTHRIPSGRVLLLSALLLAGCSQSVVLFPLDGGQCPEGSEPCESGCANLATDHANCGVCGHACAADERCTARSCVKVACVPDQACAPEANPCHEGRTTCAGDATTCVDQNTNAADGTSCGNQKVCHAGSCVDCADGEACAGDDACHLYRVSCATGAAVCTDTGKPQNDGTSCGSGEVCIGGSCSDCVADAPCVPTENPCVTGTQKCEAPAPSCEATTTPAAAGTACGTGKVCDGSGSCVACSAGLACTSNSKRCFVGLTSCDSGAQTCVDTPEPVKAGTSCGTGEVCDGNGNCVSCTAGQSCVTNPHPCKVGALDCASGAPVCDDGQQNTAAGTSCGTNEVCDGAGSCVACTAGQPCTGNPGACLQGVTSCATGTQTCVDSSTRKTPGTVCGTNEVCDGSGSCVPCTAGQSCTGNPNDCRYGVTSCDSGAQACVDGSAFEPPATPCGAGAVCDGHGNCGNCTAGTACATNPNRCKAGVTSCATGTQTCIDGSANIAPGTSCGTNEVCDGAGSCVACTAGLACSTNPNKCVTGITSCASGAQTCVDTTTPISPGTTCGTNQVCDGAGHCNACSVNQACTTNSNKCVAGVTSCTTGAQTCVNSSTPIAPGTVCGTNQVCNGAGTCVACTANQACSTNPNRCKTGVTSCSTGGQTCVDTATNVAPGTSCGTNQVCNGAGSCIACTAGAACSTNPTKCRVGAISCTTGAPVCVDTTAQQAYGTPCGGGNICFSTGQCCVSTYTNTCYYYGPQDVQRSCKTSNWCVYDGQSYASQANCYADPSLCGDGTTSDNTSCLVYCNHEYIGTYQCDGSCK